MRLNRQTSPVTTPGRTLRAAVAGCAVAVAAAVVVAPADAEPRPTVESVEKLYDQAEALNEEVNQLTEDIAGTERSIADLSADIATQQARADVQREALGASIVQQQMDAPLGTTVSLIGSGDPTEFLDGLGAVQALNATRADKLEEYGRVSAELDNRRKQLKQQRDEIAAARKKAAAKQKTIKTKHDEAKAELDRLTAAEQAGFNASTITFDGKIDAKGRAGKALKFALAQLGDKYVYGGTGPDGWDCSGLVQAAYRSAGVSLPRVVGPQMAAVKKVSMDSLQPGDLVAYSSMSHIGMYVGNGKVVHAPRPGKSVEITGLGGFSVAGRVG